MPQVKDTHTFNGVMNQDIDPRFMKAGDFIDALNIRPDRQGGSFSTMTQLQDYTPATSDYTCVGIFPDEINDLIYWFGTSATNPDLIRQYNIFNDTWTTIVSSNALNFSAIDHILSFDVTEGYVFFTDGVNPPRMLDLSFDYTAPGSLNEQYFNIAKVVPRSQPQVSALSDTSYSSNNILGKFFQFKYRFVFSNKQKSVFSPISDVAYTPDDFASPATTGDKGTKYNAIDVIMTGDGVMEFVDKIEVAARAGNTGDFFIIKDIDADATFLSGGIQTLRFYNEGLYAPMSLQESNQIYDDVPKLASALSFINNRVILGDVTTGYDKVAVDYSMEVVYADGVNPSTQSATTTGRDELADDLAGDPGDVQADGTDLAAFFLAQFSYAALADGDTIRCVGVDLAGGYDMEFGDFTVTVETGDTWQDIVTKLNYPYFDHPFFGPPARAKNFIYVDVPNGNVGNDGFTFYLDRGQHIKTFKSGAWYNVGLQYFDEYGRTNGVQIQEDSKVYIKTLGERGLASQSYVGAGAATINVTINSEAPSWAKYYKIVYSRANVYDFNLQMRAYEANDLASTGNLKLDISTLGDWNEDRGGNLGYVYEKGDMLRILTYDKGGAQILTDWAGGLLEVEIIGSDGNFAADDGRYSIIIPIIETGGVPLDETRLGNGFLFEIFRNSKEIAVDQAIFYESLMYYEVYESSGSYYHYGDTDQTVSVSAQVSITGDAYILNREDFPYYSGAIELAQDAAFESYSISDYRDSEHYSKGRPTAIINQEEAQRISTLMYSEKVIPNTDINKLNRFYPDINFEEYNRSFGNVVVLSNEGDHLLMLQHDKTSKIYVDRDIMYNAQGQAQLVGTQNTVLSASMPYAGEYGIQDPLAFTNFGNRKYWVDKLRGVAIRLSNDGITEISRYGMADYFNDACTSASIAGDHLCATYDPLNDEVIFSFVDPVISNAKTTIVFSEDKNGFVTRMSYDMNYAAYLNNRLYIVSDDKRTLYRKDFSSFSSNPNNNKLGTTDLDAPFVIISGNMEPDALKNYLSVHLDSVYPMEIQITVPTINPGDDQQTTTLESDFVQREQEWHGPVFRDINTPNLDPNMSDLDWADRVIFLGDTIKGKHAEVKATITSTYFNEISTRITTVGVVVSAG